MGLDKRIGLSFLNAGIGYGDSCFPKDVKALTAYSKSLGYNLELLEAVENVNENQPYKAIQLCKKFLANLKGKNITILGLAFKPNTDDMREARSIPIINQLLKEGAKITAYDPAATQKAKSIFKNKIRYASSTIQCLKESDCCILVTEWNEFKKTQTRRLHPKHETTHPDRWKKNIQPRRVQQKTQVRCHRTWKVAPTYSEFYPSHFCGCVASQNA